MKSDNHKERSDVSPTLAARGRNTRKPRPTLERGRGRKDSESGWRRPWTTPPMRGCWISSHPLSGMHSRHTIPTQCTHSASPILIGTDSCTDGGFQLTHSFPPGLDTTLSSGSSYFSTVGNYTIDPDNCLSPLTTRLRRPSSAI